MRKLCLFLCLYVVFVLLFVSDELIFISDNLQGISEFFFSFDDYYEWNGSFFVFGKVSIICVL